jgi:hypothetical protein
MKLRKRLAFLLLVVFAAVGALLGGACNDHVGGIRRSAVVSDQTASLVWQQFASSAAVDWYRANAICTSGNFDGAGGWRLPTISELRSLTQGCAGAAPGGACGVTDECTTLGDCGNAACYLPCADNGGPTAGCWWPSDVAGVCSAYWSSTATTDNPGWYWTLDFSTGSVLSANNETTQLVRCVRGTTFE